MRVYQKPNGVWYIAYPGNVRRSLYTTDEREARKLFRDLKKDYYDGKLRQLEPEKNMPLSAFTTMYLESRQGMAIKTQKQDALALRLLAEAIGGNTPLRNINVKRLDEFKSVCFARGVKPQSLNSYLRHIRSALNKAYEWQLLTKPAKVKKVKEGSRLPKLYTPEEMNAVLRWSRENHYELYRIARFGLYTALRRTEILNLQWQDCAMNETPTARIRGKGDKERIVPLHPEAVRAMGDPLNIGRVFADIKPDTLTHWMQRACLKCGIKGKAVHSLRHTCATYLLASGVNIRLVQEIMGHAQLSTTMLYTHLIKERLYEEVGKLRFE